jgi:6-phosphofructokinase 1
MGAMAVELLCQGKTNRVVCYKNGVFTDFDISEALSMKKEIPLHQYEISKMLAI